MFKLYFKSTWRNLIKSKFYTFVNIGGITLGLTVGILILLWVQNEFSFDKFHHKGKNIYRLENKVGTGSSRQIWTSTVAPIAVLAKNEIPAVKEYTRISNTGYFSQYKYMDKVFTQPRTAFTDPSLFSMFDFHIIAGNKADPFPHMNSVVLTKSTAKKYFGDEDPIGKLIIADDAIGSIHQSFEVSGVINDIPKNSSVLPQASMLFPMTYMENRRDAEKKEGPAFNNDFINFTYDTYLLLKPGVAFATLADKVRAIHLAHKPDDIDIQYLFQPLAKLHLYQADGSDGGISTVRMFILIAILILVIACINYVNLSTARSLLRAKEVSVRKIIGARRWQLFVQFIMETAILFSISAILSIIAVYLLMPVFNRVSGQELRIDFGDLHVWMLIITTILSALILSSIYPAIQLSSFKPLNALNGKLSPRVKDALFRKILVVGQFVFSVVLIAGTIIITLQLSYIRSKQLGYDKAHVFTFNMWSMNQHYDAIKNDLMKKPGIHNITWADNNIVDMGNQTGNNSWAGKQEGETLMLNAMAVDKNFIPFFKMQMAAGSNFTGAVSDSTHFILNETAIKAARIKNPIGKRFKIWDIEGTIIGVVKDFNFASMRQKIQPAIFYYHPGLNGLMYVRTTGKDAPKAIKAVKQKWQQYFPQYPFSYAFLDDTFNQLYWSENRTGTLFNIFAGIAIFISSLGLFGLVTFSTEVKRKEIGIRKVLGATATRIVQLISKDFLKLVLLAVLIATPIAWLLMHQWLKSFSYKITISWWTFVLAGLVALLIALATVSFQAVKAALANPVDSLKSD